MIIDSHSHIGDYRGVWSKKMVDSLMPQFGRWDYWMDPSRKWRPEDFHIDPDRYVEYMDKTGIDMAVIFGLAITHLDCSTTAEYVAEIVARHQNRFIGFHVVDPIGGLKAVEEIDHAVKDLALKGIKIFPAYNEVAPNDPRLFPIYERCLALDIPITVHMGYTTTARAMLEFQRPTLLDEIGLLFPGLKLIVAHLGCQWSYETLMLMEKYPSFYADASMIYFPIDHIARTLSWAKHFGSITRIIYGSDYPLLDPGAGIQLFRRVPQYTEKAGIEPVVTDDDIDMVLGRNAAQLFNVSAR